jgi:hypothetical protein
MRHLEIARGQLHVREDKSSNEDKAGQIAVYRRAVRDSRYEMQPGDAYCAAFVSYCLEQAGEPLEHEHGIGFSYVPWLHAWLVQEDLWFTAPDTEPTEGDLVLFSLGGARPDHVGFVEKVQGDGVRTIEGNVGGFPSGGVKRMTRKYTSGTILGFGAINF